MIENILLFYIVQNFSVRFVYFLVVVIDIDRCDSRSRKCVPERLAYRIPRHTRLVRQRRPGVACPVERDSRYRHGVADASELLAVEVDECIVHLVAVSEVEEMAGTLEPDTDVGELRLHAYVVISGCFAPGIAYPSGRQTARRQRKTIDLELVPIPPLCMNLSNAVSHL